ncbi:MAG: toll/interleukin-1 receptor domain-containing protein, partial [Bacteroidota bacterium]
MDSESIFVSYSSEDRPFALEFVKALQELGVNVWIDQLGIQLGENWDHAIEQALENSQTFLLFISPNAVESKNVHDEFHIAVTRNKKLIPILIKQCDLPMRWQRLQYADLTKNPARGLRSVMEFLGLEKTATKKLREVLSLIGVSEADQNQATISPVSHDEPPSSGEVHLLISEDEIDCATPGAGQESP